MNCNHFQNQLDDYLDGALPSQDVLDMQMHAKDCSSCNQRLAEHEAYMQSMKAMPMPAMSPGFAQRSLRRAAEQKQQHRTGFVRGFSSALAAGLAMWAVVAIWMPEPGVAPQDQLANVSLELHQESTINLVFYSPKAVADAKFSIILPDHVEVVGFGDQHVISWQTTLQEGKNILPLPLKASAQPREELMASIESGNSKKVFRLNIKVSDNKQSKLLVPVSSA